MPRVKLTQPHSGRAITVDSGSADLWRSRGYTDAPPSAPAPTGRHDAESLTKADLIDLAEQRGVKVSQSWTKAEIASALED